MSIRRRESSRFWATGPRPEPARLVRCTHCDRTYNLGAVTATVYDDCATWVAPCCGRTVDNKGTPGNTGFKIRADFTNV